MTVDRSAFVDDSGETRFAGTIQPGVGTTAGDVLTSQGDGLAAQWAAGGGSSAPVNWAVLSLIDQILTPGSGKLVNWNDPGDFSLLDQSGDDFSIDGSGNLITAAGGNMAFGAYISNPGATLDGGSTAQRWLQFGISVAGGVGPGSDGFDVTIPLTATSVENYRNIIQTAAGLPSYVAPGGVVLDAATYPPFANLIGGNGTDSVTFGANVDLWIFAV